MSTRYCLVAGSSQNAPFCTFINLFSATSSFFEPYGSGSFKLGRSKIDLLSISVSCIALGIIKLECEVLSDLLILLKHSHGSFFTINLSRGPIITHHKSGGNSTYIWKRKGWNLKIFWWYSYGSHISNHSKQHLFH